MRSSHSHKRHTVPAKPTGPAASQETIEPGRDRTAAEAAYYDYIRPRSTREHVEHLVDVLYKGKWLILVTFLIVFSAVAVYTYTRAPEFEAFSLVLVSNNTNPTAQEFTYGAGDLFAGAGDVSLTNELVILRHSLPLTRRVARQLMELQVVPETGEALSLLATEAGEPLTVDQVAGRIQEAIHFTPEDRGWDNRVIRMTTTSTSPGEAALVANLYTEAYVNLTQEASRARLGATREFLAGQEQERHADLQTIEEEIKTYMSREGAVNLDEEGSLVVAQTATAEAERDNAQIELQMRRATLQALEEELAAMQPQLAQRIASGVEREIEAMQARIAQLELAKEQIYLHTPELRQDAAGDPRLQELSTQILELRRGVNELSEQYVAEVLAVGGMGLTAGEGLVHIAELKRQIVAERIAISGLQAKIEVLAEDLAGYEAELSTIPAQAMELAQLQRGRAYAERTYQFIVERLQETRINEESELGYAAIIREALVPGAPVRPDTRHNLFLGILLGLFLGIALAVTRDKLDNRLYTPEDLQKQGDHVIAVIPDMRPMLKHEYQGESFVEQGGRRWATTLVSLLNPLSSIAEAYRHLRTSIQFSLPDTVVQTILVTSPSSGEGKSVTATNLAVAMAQAGRRTLLVDADLRRPQMYQLFDLPREPGLVELVFSDTDLDVEALQTGFDDLYVLTSGKAIANPAELLGSQRLRTLIETLRNEFDIVVFDTPPVFAATDAVLLSTQCDATLVVVKAGHTKDYELKQCLDVLDGVGASLIGTVLNQFGNTLAYGSTTRYGYTAYYGEYPPSKKRSSRASRRS